MFLPPTQLLSILEHYKYWIIFPIAIFEGPIIIIITGFLTYLGVVNIFVAYPILVLADTIGDTMYYYIGRFWHISKWIKKAVTFLGYDEKSQAYLENHFKKHTRKTLLASKISHGLGSSIQISSGIAGVPYMEFLLYSVMGTIPKTLVLFLVGFFIGSSYIKIDNYLDYIALFTFGFFLLIILYLIINKNLKRSILKDK